MNYTQVLQLSGAEFFEHVENHQGWCKACQEFTRGSTEPDAENYPCPACGKSEVYGLESLLISGQVDIDPRES